MAIVTNPNTVPNTSGSKASNASTATGGGASTKTLGKIDKNYQDFLTLLTTQLQNQDPSAPTDTNQLTQQIATLSQVEQQLNTNKNLEKLISMYSATQYNSVVSYIGKQIEAEGDGGALQKTTANFAYSLDSAAASVEITIRDKDGNVVRSDKTGGRKQEGRNDYVWDGKNNDGSIMPAGEYSISVAAKNAQGAAINQNLITAKATLNDVKAKYIYYLSGAASAVTVTIKDSSGNAVRTDSTNGTKIAGRNEYVWDGKDDKGNIMPEGTYKITVAAKDQDNKNLTSKTFITGVVQSVDSVDGVAYLSFGDISVPLQNVTSIRTPS